MPDKVLPGPVHGNPCIKEAVCIHTNRVYDSCRDKDCLQDLRLYPTRYSQDIIERATSVKCRHAELIWCFVDVEDIQFNRGFYTVDVKFFYKVTLDAFLCVGRPHQIEGLCTFDKRVILFGSEGNAKIFSSSYRGDALDKQLKAASNLPSAVVEAVDPIALDVKLVDRCDCNNGCESDRREVPEVVCSFFDEELVISNEGRSCYVTLGQFSIIKLERKSQLLIPSYDFCIPDKECCGNENDPCDLFNKINFPVDEFFPPQQASFGIETPVDNRRCCR